MVQRSRSMVLLALVLVALALWGLTKVPSGFIPAEDQGYLMVAVQMPDGASLGRTEKAMDEIARMGLKTPGVERAIAIGTGGPSPLDGDVSLANAGHRLSDAEELGRARQRAGSRAHLPKPLDSARSHAGGAHPSFGAAADPGTWRCQRLSNAGRTNRWQL